MIGSLRWRFFAVVWLLLVAGLVGLGTLLTRWGTVEISRVTAEAQVNRMLARSDVQLTEALNGDPRADSAAIAALLADAVARDSLLLGAAVVGRDGRIVASALPPMAPGEFTVRRGGAFEWNRREESDGHRTMIRLLGDGRRLNSRNGVDPRFLVLLPKIRAQGQMVIPDTGSEVLMTRFRWALVIGSVLAGLVTLAISGPLLGRVGALTGATARLREGDLAARVPVTGSDEIANLGRAFNAMAEGLERSESQRQQMIVDIAHELRTPLTNLTGMLEAVQDGLRSADADTLAALHEEAGLLGQLVNDLQDLALADAGELRVASEDVDVVAAASRAAAGFSAAHGLILDVPSEPVIVQADERRLGQVLRNLIQNAVTHSPVPGTVRVSVQPSPRVSIRIEDHGSGIAPGELPRIWERFYRIDPSRARATGGMGLGLPVARRLVEAMGGEIGVESRPGEGTTFTVNLG